MNKDDLSKARAEALNELIASGVGSEIHDIVDTLFGFSKNDPFGDLQDYTLSG